MSRLGVIWCATTLIAFGAGRAQAGDLPAAGNPNVVIVVADDMGWRDTGYSGKWHLGSQSTSPVKMGFDEAIWKINYYDLGASLQVGDTQQQVPLDGEISGVDAAVGNLRAELHKLGVAENTIVWFTSDNGGINRLSMDPSGKGKGNVGVRTIAVLEWPARVKQPIRTSVPCAHMDVYPTLLDIAGVKMPGQPVLDGVSLVPLLEGKMTQRPGPLGFMLWKGGGKSAQVDFATDTQGVLIDGQYKLIVEPAGAAGGDQAVRLYDIFADPAEKTNLADKLPDVVARMRKALEQWQRSVQSSYEGNDFAKATSGK